LTYGSFAFLRLSFDAVRDPGTGGSRSSCKSPVAVQGLRCPAVSPLSGEYAHRAAHQPNPSLAATASVACVKSHCFGHSKSTFEATYRIQLPSLHLATFPPPATLAVGFGYGRLTILTRGASHPLEGEPYPGSGLFSPCPYETHDSTSRCGASPTRQVSAPAARTHVRPRTAKPEKPAPQVLSKRPLPA